MKNKRALLAIALLLLIVGAPVTSRVLSSFNPPPPSKSNALSTFVADNGTITANLTGLKKDEIPVLNLHTTADLYYFNKELGTSIDFGALEALGSNAVYRGQTVTLAQLDGRKFKVLTDKKNKSIVTGLISYESLYVPTKRVLVQGLATLKSSDLSVAISDLFIFLRDKQCFTVLNSGDNLKTKCPELVYTPPYHFDYLPKDQTLKITPTWNPLWEQIRVYKTPLYITYGKVKGAKYKKNKIPVEQKVRLASARINTVGGFELDARNLQSQNISVSATKDDNNDERPFYLSCGTSQVEVVQVKGAGEEYKLLDEREQHDAWSLNTSYQDIKDLAEKRCTEIIRERVPEYKAVCPQLISACGANATDGCSPASEIIFNISNHLDFNLSRTREDGPQVICKVPSSIAIHLSCSKCNYKSSSSSSSLSNNSTSSSSVSSGDSNNSEDGRK